MGSRLAGVKTHRGTCTALKQTDINRTRQGYLTGSSPEAARELCGFNILKLSAVAGPASSETARPMSLDRVWTQNVPRLRVLTENI